MTFLNGKFRAIILTAVMLLMVAQPVLAQNFSVVDCGRRNADGTTPDANLCQWTDMFELAYRIVNYLIGMAGFVAIMFIVWGGLQMLLSAGNTSRVQEAKSTIWNAILGLVLTLLAYLIIGYVVRLLLPGVGGDPIRGLMDFLPGETE
jgi:ABC-type Fe3+ transport system permease subunit